MFRLAFYHNKIDSRTTECDHRARHFFLATNWFFVVLFQLSSSTSMWVREILAQRNLMWIFDIFTVFGMPWKMSAGTAACDNATTETDRRSAIFARFFAFRGPITFSSMFLISLFIRLEANIWCFYIAILYYQTDVHCTYSYSYCNENS